MLDRREATSRRLGRRHRRVDLQSLLADRVGRRLSGVDLGVSLAASVAGGLHALEPAGGLGEVVHRPVLSASLLGLAVVVLGRRASEHVVFACRARRRAWRDGGAGRVALRGWRLECHLAAGLGGAVGDQGVDVLVVVVEPLGVVEDEVAVDQVVEHQRALLDLAVVLGLVLDLDVVIVALVDPGELARRGRRGRPAPRGCPSRLPMSSNADSPLTNGMTLPIASTKPGGVNAMTQRPSGMPAQTACQTEPSSVAPKARVVPRSRITPLVPR